MRYPRLNPALQFILMAMLCSAAQLSADTAAVSRDAATFTAAASSSDTPPAPIDISKCHGPFRCEAFLDTAAALQLMPEPTRAAQLQHWADLPGATEFTHPLDLEVIELCRMLFEPKPGQSFRNPVLGSPVYVGDNRISHYAGETGPSWPLQPIALVDGIPFRVVKGYNLAGRKESASEYLKYCLDKMQWTSRHYAPTTPTALHKALDRLVRETAWFQPLTASDVKFLSDQILPATAD